MKQIIYIGALCCFWGLGVLVGEASPTSNEGDGRVTIEKRDETQVVDPENPDDDSSTIDGPKTVGELRIDFAPIIDFGEVEIKNNNRVYYPLAQKLSNPDKIRSHFVQVSDFREAGTGWSLQMKQEKQFHTTDGKVLKGAMLSFDNGWANSSGASKRPIVTRDTIAINNFNEVYQLAIANPSCGSGVWSVSFGASKGNKNGQKETIINESESKANDLYRNSAIALSIPSEAKIIPGEYSTKITWILGELP